MSIPAAGGGEDIRLPGAVINFFMLMMELLIKIV
jgi:hypothetical protein